MTTIITETIDANNPPTIVAAIACIRPDFFNPRSLEASHKGKLDKTMDIKTKPKRIIGARSNMNN